MESNKDKLSKIPEVRAQRTLEGYDGFNNYIQSIQKKFREQIQAWKEKKSSNRQKYIQQ